LSADRERSLQPAQAALWGGCWGVSVGSLEAAWHLTHWQLYTTTADAVGFFVRAVLYGAAFFAIWTAAVTSTCRAAASFKPGSRLDRVTGGRQLEAGAIVAGTVTLFGVVVWRVGYHINDPWGSPVLLGGIAAVLAVAALAGAAVAVLSAGPVARFPRMWAWPLPALLLFGLTFVGGGSSVEDAERPRRVLLITLDTFRADRLGAAGGTVATPVLDALAERGVMFEQAVAQAPITNPAHLSLFSSTPSTTHGVFANGTRIPQDLPLIQESFAAEGVPTAAFVAGYPVTARFGFDRGYDVFDDDFSDSVGDHRLTVRRLIDQVVYARGAPRERIADAVIDRARPWLEAHASGEFFCWVHLFDPHGPYAPPAPFVESIAGPMPGPAEGPEMPQYWPAAHRRVAVVEYWKQRYDEEIAYTDHRVGRLLQVLDEHGALDGTVVAVVADHGESLDEHEYYFEHGLHLYDASLRIPMLIAGPGVPRARTVPCQVRGMDLAPTLLGLVDLAVPRPFEGEDLRPLWEQGCPDEGLRFSVAATVEPPWLTSPGPELALRTDGTMRFKYVRHRRSDDELFDLIADPGELDNLVGVQVDVERYLLDHLLRASEGMAEEAPAIPADVEAQLRALGYLGDGPAPPPPAPSRRDADDDDSARDGREP